MTANKSKTSAAGLDRRSESFGLLRHPYALNELPHPQVDFTFGLLNLNPDPSRVST